MRVAIWLGLLAGGFGVVISPARAAEHTKDSLETVKKAVAEDKAILLDVREKSEWDDGHLKGAKHLPLSLLKAGAKAEAVAEIIPKGTVVYCHCGSGIRCLRAADELKKLGFEVRPLKPGYEDLLNAGFKPASK